MPNGYMPKIQRRCSFVNLTKCKSKELQEKLVHAKVEILFFATFGYGFFQLIYKTLGCSYNSFALFSFYREAT